MYILVSVEVIIITLHSSSPTHASSHVGLDNTKGIEMCSQTGQMVQPHPDYIAHMHAEASTVTEHK